MFTGLVEGKGKVKSVERSGDGVVLSVMPLLDASDCRIGDSISVDGVCLTITRIQEAIISMDVSGETVFRSTIGQLQPGDEVNLERALRLTDRLGGHLVSGHVDGIGVLLKSEKRQQSWLLRIGISKELGRYTIEKGSIAVDGVSLTINRCTDTYFEINIIPQTAKETTILEKKVGDHVNIETDLIGKYVEKFFMADRSMQEGGRPSRIDRDMLKRYGFGD